MKAIYKVYLILIFYFISCIISPLDSFQTTHTFLQPLSSHGRRVTSLITVKPKQLSTVSTKFRFDNIPRLEIGLRFIRNMPKSCYDKIIYINPMEWLSDGRRSNYPSRSRSNHLLNPGQLFKSIRNNFKSLASSVMGYLKKVLATAMVISTSFTLPSFKKLSMLASSTAAAVTMMPSYAHAGILKQYNKLNPTQKLATTPLFYVCNSQGNPFLQEDVQSGKRDQKIVIYFMSSEDANDYFSDIVQSNPANVNEFRIMATSMEKIVNKIQSRKQSRKMGRYAMSMVYRIQPSSRQCENADKVMGNGDAAKGNVKMEGISIPMFTANGMGIRRSNGEQVTPYYFAYEDLLNDWKKVIDEAPPGSEVPKTPSVSVKDFVDVMCLSKGLNAESLQLVSIDDTETNRAAPQANDILKTAAIIPPKREIELLGKYYRNKIGMKGEFQSARIMGMPRQ